MCCVSCLSTRRTSAAIPPRRWPRLHWSAKRCAVEPIGATDWLQWHPQAQALLWASFADALCRHDGYYVPAILGAIHADPTLGQCVRALNITAPLEGALWCSAFTTEGDVMAALIRACPNVTEITVPSFEWASRENVLDALRSAQHVETFRVRCVESP